MSSPTVMFVLGEVVRNGDPRPGDSGVMIALGPGMAAKVALLRWYLDDSALCLCAAMDSTAYS
jgi:predicted naringenin-chalcone synthase